PVRKGLRPRGRRPQRRDGESGYERASRNAHRSSYGSSYPVHCAILTQPPTKTTAILCYEAAFSKTERRTNCNHPRVRPQASIAIENASARTDDVLHFRLQHPPRRQLRLVHHLYHGFAAAHREE